MTREEAIKILMSANVWTDEERTALEILIPELAESEDERVRKEIISALKFANDDGVYDKHISWLEKQKEQKPVDLPAGFYFIDLDGNKYYSKEFRMGDMKMKVVENVKPAEWSEEDEKMRCNILNVLTSTIVYTLGSHGTFAYKYNNEIEWLKSLKPQYHGDVTMTEAYKMGKEAGIAEGRLEREDMWKPSEEQMGALLAVFNDPNNIGSQTCQLALTGLYEDLKKLIEDKQ